MSSRTRHIAWLPLLVCCGLLVGCTGGDGNALAKAKASIAANESAAAVIHLKNALVKDPKSAEARFLLGEQLWATGDALGAVSELNRALELKYPIDRVAPLLSTAMVSVGQTKQMLELFKLQPLTDPQSIAQVQASIAMAHLALGNLPAAREAIVKGFAADPKSVRTRLIQARVALAEGNPAAALSQAEALLAEVPKDENVWSFKGELLERSPAGHEQAMAAYAKAVEINPKNFRALSSLAGLQMVRSDLPAARETLVAMRKLAPKAFMTQYYDGRLSFLGGDYSAARGFFQAALNLQPENPIALLASGVNELALKAFTQSEAQLSRAVALQPGNVAARYYLAQANMKLGRADQASRALAPLLNAETPSSEVLLTAAQARLLQGEPSAAEALVKRAAKLHPKDLSVRVAMAMVSAARGDTGTAVRELQLISESSEGAEADLRLIGIRTARNEFDAALTAIDALERKRPKDPVASELRGQVLLGKKDTAGARAAFEAALKKDANYIPVIAQLAELDLIENKTEQASQRIAALAKREPNNANVQLAVAALAARSGANSTEVSALIEKATQADPNDVRARLLLIDEHLRSGRRRAALDAAQAAVTAIPDHASLLEALARCQMQLGQDGQALTSYGKLVRVAPKEPAGYLGQAAVLFKQNDFDAAAKSLQQLLTIQPRSIEARRLSIAVAIKRKQADKALAIARELQSEFPTKSFGWQLEGDVHLDQGRWTAAATALRAGMVKQQPELLAPRLHTALTKDKQVAEAERFAAGWLTDHPKDIAFLIYLAERAHEANDVEQTRRRFEQVLAIDPKNAAALNNLSWVLLQNKLPGAVAMAERAAALAPAQPEVLDTLAQAYAADKQYAKAADAFNRAISSAVDPAPLRLALAKVYLEAGERDKGRAELERLRDLGKDFAQQAEVRRLLATPR